VGVRWSRDRTGKAQDDQREDEVDEAAWLTATDPTPMLAFLRNAEKARGRKLRLFAAACCRRIWYLLGDERSRRAVEVAERLADGAAEQPEADEAWHHAEEVYEADDYVGAAYAAASYLLLGDALATGAAAAEAVYDAADTDAEGAEAAERAVQAALLRDIFGNPFVAPPRIDASVLRWSDGCVVRIAEGIYQERAFERMGILADALLDAGCDNDEVLSHCRDPGGHVRGCFVLDLLLNKG
jgi:hypothetical protein